MTGSLRDPAAVAKWQSTPLVRERSRVQSSLAAPPYPLARSGFERGSEKRSVEQRGAEATANPNLQKPWPKGTSTAPGPPLFRRTADDAALRPRAEVE